VRSMNERTCGETNPPGLASRAGCAASPLLLEPAQRHGETSCYFSERQATYVEWKHRE
jgi:hypothetical protein